MIAEINSHAFEVNDLTNGFIRLIILIIPNMLFLILGVGAISILAVSLQTGWNRRQPWIKYTWTFLNPLNGLKRIFSIYGLINFLKSFAKFILISPIAYFALKDFAPRMVMLIHASMEDVMALTGFMMSKVFWKTAYVFIFVALVDYGWGKFRWLKQYKMTKEEVKDERKAMEGDESTKRKMLAKGLQRHMSSM